MKRNNQGQKELPMTDEVMIVDDEKQWRLGRRVEVIVGAKGRKKTQWVFLMITGLVPILRNE